MNLHETDPHKHQPVLLFDDVHAESSAKKRAAGRVSPRVSGISAVVRSGESVGILGEQDDGVSVLMQAAAGLITPEDGTVLVRSQPAQINAATAFPLDETLRANVERVAMSLELNGAKLRKAVQRIFARLDLENCANELCADVDPIDIERVRLAATLQAGPALLLMDEPLVRGRALLGSGADDGLERFLRTGGAFLLAGRDPTVMRRVCQRILWLKEGEIIMDSPAAVVAREYARLEEVKGDRKKAGQLYRRFARDYAGIKVVAQDPTSR